jgi:exosortase
MTQSTIVPASTRIHESVAASTINVQPAKLAKAKILWAVLMAVALAALFHVNLARLWQVTNPFSGDPSWDHAVYLPLISLAYLYMRREKLAALPAQPQRCGLLLLIGGIGTFAYGICMASTFPALSSFVQDAGMLLTLLAVVLCIFGWSMTKLAIFPIGFLLCGIPWPPTLIDIATAPLQHLAATASVWILAFSPLDVEQVGNTIHVLAMKGPDRVLEVAEACSGLRSIAVFIALGLSTAFLSPGPLWRAILVSLCAVPVAILCNVMRIVGDVLLDHYVSHTLSEGFYHTFTGVVLLVPGVFFFLSIGTALDWLAERHWLPGTRVASTPAIFALPVKKREIGCDDTLPSDTSVARMYFTVLTVVVVAAGAFGVTTRVLQLHFQKDPVLLAVPINRLPTDLGPWRSVGADRPLAPDVQSTLGTNQYVFREYLDTRVLGAATIEGLRRRSDGQSAAAALAASRPNASVHLSLTYYTGRVDSVSHIPERCYVGGGEASSVQSVQTRLIVAGRPMDLRLVTIDAPRQTPGAIHYVAYCYRVNGRQESETWRVRRSLLNVFAREAWYAKIEVATPVADADQAALVLSDFLSFASPEIERRLPGGTATTPSRDVTNLAAVP